jgi:hypothetical protein
MNIQNQNMIDAIFTILSNHYEEGIGKTNHLQFTTSLLLNHQINIDFFVKYLILRDFRSFSYQIQVYKVVLYYYFI